MLAMVEEVRGSGSILISESNALGLGVVSTREISASNWPQPEMASATSTERKTKHGTKEETGSSPATGFAVALLILGGNVAVICAGNGTAEDTQSTVARPRTKTEPGQKTAGDEKTEPGDADGG